MSSEETVTSLGTFRALRIDQIVIPETKLREVQLNSPKYENLSRAIETAGMITSPILVLPTADPEKFVLDDGMQRLSIAKKLNWSVVPTFEPHKPDGTEVTQIEAMGMMISSNFCRVDTKPIQASKLIHEMLNEDPTLGVPAVAALTGQSEAWVRDRMALKGLNEALTTAVDSGDIGITKAKSLAKLPQAEQMNYQAEAIRDDVNAFCQKIDARVRAIKEETSKGEKAKEAVFVPIARRREKAEMQTELHTQEQARVIAPEAPDAFTKGVQWALSLDDATVSAAKAKFDADQAQVKARREEREARVAAEKAAKEAAKAAAAE